MRPTALGKLATLALITVAAFAQPPLTTIQDTLYKADGTLFNGLLIISWNSFLADNQANIVSQSITVQVVGGIFQVQLVPTADANPPTAYTVTYNSAGKIQFQETWVVPVSTTPLTISQVRTSNSTTTASPVQPAQQTPIAENAVTGLTNDLSLRPIKGPGFATGSVAMIDPNGMIDAVVGNPSDCVFVGGTSGPCSTGGGVQYSDGETPGGTMDGNNASFTLANAPSPAQSLVLFRNGIAQNPAADYTLSGSTVQFLTGAVPQPGDSLSAWYRLSGGSSGSQTGAVQYSDGETPGGTMDGVNATFTLLNSPSPAHSLELFRNGVALQSSVDYTLSGSTVQFLSGAVPEPGDTLLAWYRLGAGSSGPQINCSAPGTSTSSTSFTSLGTCTFPSNTLQTGDRIEIHFDLAHTGTSSGFEYQVVWGATVVTDRVAGTGDAMIAGKDEAAVYSAGSQLRAESWGTVLAYTASVGNATDSVTGALTINFQMRMAQATSDTVALNNFTVVRYPAH